MPKRTAVYAGTFDPVTLGHLDVIRRALQLFDSVTVAVTSNPRKKALFSLRERIALLKECTRSLPRVSVDSFQGLLVAYVKGKRARVILRGLRELSDFEFEFQQALINRKLAPDLETVFVMTSPRFFYLNSTAVKEIASLGGKIDCFVSPCVEKALQKKFRKAKKA